MVPLDEHDREPTAFNGWKHLQAQIPKATAIVIMSRAYTLGNDGNEWGRYKMNDST